MAMQIMKVMNTKEELVSFPLEQNIKVLLQEKPHNIAESFFLYMLDWDQDVPKVGDKNINHFQVIQEQATVPFSFSTEEYNEGGVIGHVLTINPSSPLVPNHNYVLIVSKDIKSDTITTSKVTQVGPAQIWTKPISPLPEGTESRKYVLTIDKNSVMNSDSNAVAYTIDSYDDDSTTSNGTQAKTVDLGSTDDHSLYKDNHISIGADLVGVPFIKGEQFEIVYGTFEVDQDTEIVLQIETAQSDQVTTPPEKPSGRLTLDDFNKFYKASTTIPGGGTGGAGTGTDTAETYDPQWTFRPPNKLVIDLQHTIDPSSIKLITVVPGSDDAVTYFDFLDAQFDYAFGNYLLPDMGLYKEDSKYAIFSKVTGSRLELQILELNKLSTRYTEAGLIKSTSKYDLLFEE